MKDEKRAADDAERANLAALRKHIESGWGEETLIPKPTMRLIIKELEQSRADGGKDSSDAREAKRYRWLSRKVSAHGVIDGWAFGFPSHLTLPAPPLAMRDPAAALGQAIDAAIARENK